MEVLIEGIIFVIVIVALIVVHEFGHFIAAKLSGMRVDEFGFGFPPRALTIAKKGETEYTLNWLPFGGFVKIYGEDSTTDAPRSFTSRPRVLQALVLVAGVAMNLVFAYVLLTGALIAGTPRALAPEEVANATDTQLIVATVLPGSPAEGAGLAEGDTVLSAEDGHYVFSGVSPADFSAFVARAGDNATIALTVRHAAGGEETLFARPRAGLVASDPSRAAIGVEVATIGVVPVPFAAALVQGAALTWGTLILTARELAHFFYGLFTFHANLSQVAGPIGIAGAVGSASRQGFGDLLSLMAIISINLAIVNLIPVPALDGGRLLFVLIEGATKKRIKPSVAQAVNAIGFLLLILLLVVVSVHDIFRIMS
jgi:regulator of sigma E protease